MSYALILCINPTKLKLSEIGYYIFLICSPKQPGLIHFTNPKQILLLVVNVA